MGMFNENDPVSETDTSTLKKKCLELEKEISSLKRVIEQLNRKIAHYENLLDRS